ncbi:MAG: FHA domain-containing protein, partial [Phycisphaerae bacterium]
MEIWVYNQYADQREVHQVDDDNVTIGRDESNNVTLKSPFVSRNHARVFRENGTYFIESLGLNGLTLANQELAAKERAKVSYGDEIRIGEFSLYMMEASARRVKGKLRTASARKRVIELEQKLHSQLLDRLNLRVTGQSGADEQLVLMIKRNLDEIIDKHIDDVDAEMSEHLTKEFLWRGVVTELSRRATGKLMYSYGFEHSELLDSKHEDAISRMIGDVVGFFPLRLRPHTLKEDVAMVEAEWDKQLAKLTPRLSPELRQYITRRMLPKE